MKCPRCPRDVAADAQFCPECGAQLSLVCSHCATTNAPNHKFCKQCGQPLPSVLQPLAGGLPRATPGAEAERRQLTVMFCDLVGSTALAESLDPEETREIVRGYQHACAQVIERFEGHIAQYLGDGLLIYFGYPRAHEDDAPRAVRAALGLLRAIEELDARLQPKRGVRLAVRVGIHTGLVVVGEIGTGSRSEQLALGETPNLAARLQTLAEPGTVMISTATYRLIERWFACRDLGLHTAKGIATPLRVFRVLNESVAPGGFEAVSAGLTALVGRDQELGLLLDRWEQVKDGLGQVVLVSGEAGIGKSRLLRELRERLASESHTRWECRCSPYHRDSALYPIIDLFARALEFARDEPPGDKLRKIEDGLSRSGLADPETVSLWAALLSVPLRTGSPPLNLTPQRQKQKTLEAVLGWLVAMAARQPVLVLIEDLHWVDPSTLELLNLLVEQAPMLRVFVLMTFRPDFRPPWAARAHITNLTLNRLTRRQTELMAGRAAGGKSLPSEVVQQIVAKTDGVPLFVEELTKMVVESGLLREENGRYALAGPLPPLAIPTTLQDSLMARLDRLATIKDVAQLGATLGRSFPYELLRAVSSTDEPTLRQALGRLVEAELLYQRGLAPQATYIFKHALIQEAAYQSLLKSTRQQYHHRIARVLAAQFPDIAATQPELLAHHCAQAGWIDKAIVYWGLAGRQSLARSAMIESVAHVRKGLDLLAHLPEGPERWRQELDLQRILGAALLASKGNAAPETGEAYARARELCERLGDTASLIPVLGGLSTYYQTRGEYPAMRGVSEDLLRIGAELGDTAGSLVGSRSMGLCLYHLGEFVAARPHFERVLDLYTPEAHNALVNVTSFDVRTGALGYLSMIRCIEGQPEQAASFSGQALAVARGLRNPHNLTFALNYAAISRLLQRVELEAEELLDEQLSLAIEHGFPVWSGTANIMRGYVLARRDEPEAGLALARKGWADWTATGARYHGTFYLGLLAQTCERAGQTDEALALVATALESVDRMRERWFEAELRRVQGEWLVVHRPEEIRRAEACFQRAIAVAREQQARLWELRATTSLARLWRDQGKRVEAGALLALILGWLTEGLDTADLRNAKMLLDELSSTPT